jgi:hypothetical protein
MVLVKGKNAKHLFVDFIAVSYTITRSLQTKFFYEIFRDKLIYLQIYA